MFVVSQARPFTMIVYFESILFCCSQAHSICLLQLCRTEYMKPVDMKAFETGLIR